MFCGQSSAADVDVFELAWISCSLSCRECKFCILFKCTQELEAVK